MATYKQTYTFREYRRGHVTVTFMLSDTYSGLFSSTAGEVNFFLLDETSKEISTTQGGLAEHELTFDVDEAAVKTATEQAALTMLKLSRNPNNKIYCGVFIDTASTPDIADADFIGLVQHEWEAKDLKWHGEYYTDTPAPLRRWRLRARPYSNAVMDKVTVDEIINGSTDPYVPGIDESWIAANVNDVQAYFKRYKHNKYYTLAVKNLVDFDVLLRKLADNFSAIILARFGITLNIRFERSVIDGKWFPVRWNHIDRWEFVRYVRQGFDCKVYNDDGQTIAIDPDGANTNKFYISFQNIKLYKSYEPMPESAKQMLWSNKVKTFNELIYRIAHNFGCIPIMSYDDSETLRIQFVSRRQFGGNNIYIAGATSGKLKGEAVINDKDAEKWYGKANYLCLEGPEYYGKRDDGSIISSKSLDRIDPQAKNELLLTISPTLCYLPWGDDRGIKIPNVAMPHNLVFVNGGTYWDDTWYHYSYGLHTGVYLKVAKYPGHFESTEADEYYAPVIMMKINTNLAPPHRAQYSFFRLADYVNFLAKLEIDLYSLQYELDIPFYYAFSFNADGSSASWKNVQIGSKITLDGVVYVVEGIKRKLSEPLVTLKLQAWTKYNFDDFVDTDMTFDKNEGDDIPQLNEHYEQYEAGGTINAYNYVSIKDDGTIIPSTESLTHRSRYLGIAINGGNVGDTIIVQRHGAITNEDWNFTVGDKIFINSLAVAGKNLSTTPHTEPTSAVKMYVIVGVAESATTLRILEPPEEYTMDEQ